MENQWHCRQAGRLGVFPAFCLRVLKLSIDFIIWQWLNYTRMQEDIHRIPELSKLGVIWMWFSQLNNVKGCKVKSLFYSPYSRLPLTVSVRHLVMTSFLSELSQATEQLLIFSLFLLSCRCSVSWPVQRGQVRNTFFHFKFKSKDFVFVYILVSTNMHFRYSRVACVCVCVHAHVCAVTLKNNCRPQHTLLACLYFLTLNAILSTWTSSETERSKTACGLHQGHHGIIR